MITKRTLAILLSITITVMMVTPAAFANNEKGEIDCSEQFELVGSENNIVKDMPEDSNSFDADFEDIEIETPKDSEDPVKMNLDNGDTVEMGFPEEVDSGKGEIENGRVIYDDDENVNVYSQVESEEICGETIVSNRMLTQIENAQAPHEYTFEFNLPNGYRLVKDEDYNREQKKKLNQEKEAILESGLGEEDYERMMANYDISNGEVYIVDDDDLVKQIIEAPWAKDANGNELFTEYKIDKSSLVQYVDFNENTAFPVLADPKVGATKSFSFKISNAEMGLPAIGISAPLSKKAKSAAKKIMAKRIGATVASKLIPGISWASWALMGFSVINSISGKKGIKISGTLVYKKRYLHKEGYYMSGWDIKSIKMSRY